MKREKQNFTIHKPKKTKNAMGEFFGGERRDALETKRQKQNFTIHKPKKTKML
jgi:hypothetical protein